MAAATVPAHAPAISPPWRRARTTLATAAARGAAMASAARRRIQRPALVIGGFGCIDAAAYQGPLWLGLVATGLSLWAIDQVVGGDE